MTTITKKTNRSSLMGATAMILVAMAIPLGAQDVRTVAPAANTEPDTAPSANASGFVISLDGQALNADPAVEDTIRRTDLQLAQADVQITFDGLNPTPRLNLEVAGASQSYAAGDVVTMRSELNYPAYVSRGEIRLLDAGAPGGARLLATVPVAPNGSTQFVVPEGREIVAVHRVYNDKGRFDETAPIPLGEPDTRNLTANEDGVDATAVRNIRVGGGAVTVSAANVAPGATLYTLGEAVQADSQGRLVIQRILPPGDYAVDVEVQGGGQNTAMSRDFTVPGSEWFYVASGELTYSGIGSDAGGETSGRLSGYVDGETESGLRVTASVDTGEAAIEDLFSRLDDRDPQSLAERLSYDNNYPTFGDDSTIVDNTPTSGRIYLRVEQNGNFGVWGDYQARLTGSEYLRNERTLYGAQAHLETQAITARGDARASFDAYGAQPDQLVGRDAFRGTGGSVYFLQREDVVAGTATLTVELRHADTNRVLERRNLVEGRDYQINYVQGVVTLSRPLDGRVRDDLIQSNVGGDVTVNLIAQYEYTPIGVDVDGLSYGARAEGWLTDDIRVGVTGMSDDTGTADQQAASVDLRYLLGQNSFVQLDYARTEGPGYTASASLDGGLIVDNTTAVSGDGEAVKVEAQVDFADLGVSQDGNVGAYYETRTLGFSTLDYQVGAATGDELLYGASVHFAPTDRVAFGLALDRYENDALDERSELTAEVDFQATAALSVALGAEYLEERTATTDGNRIDLAGRATYAISPATAVFGFVQGSAATDGLNEFNRYGVGVTHQTANGWAGELEVSDGTGGLGARVTANHTREGGESTYFGYDLDPSRALDAGVSRDDNGGRFVAGGRRQLGQDVAVFGENVYDIFGNQRSLTSVYGVEYQVNNFLSYDASLTYGQITDDANGDFDRTGVSVGMRYATEATTARLRAEVRRDDAEAGSTRSDSDFFAVSADLAQEIDPTQRLLGSLDYADTRTNNSALLEGRFVDVSLGYALRPVMNERLNVLASVRYLSDDLGQTIDGVLGAGDIQNTTVVSVEGNYDVNPQWTLGAKLGYRSAETGADEDSLAQNDALLAVANARYHFVNKWDVLLEARHFDAMDAGLSETGLLGAVYRHVGQSTQIGLGYNFGSFSDDLTDLTTDDGGAFINIVTSF